jgi:hypothetical protein
MTTPQISHQVRPQVPQIPRAQWPTHPRFGTQVLLLRSHEGFRRISAHLLRAAPLVDPLDPLPLDPGERTQLARAFVGWISAMRSHEAYEEHKLYPFLRARFSIDFAAARAGHAALHEVQVRVRAAFLDADTQAGRDELLSALRAHDSALRGHLELEEDLVIPALLSLRPAEFEALTSQPIEALLQALSERGTVDAT